MSLTIDTTLEYLRVKLGLSLCKLQEYSNKTIKEIIEAEAASGNQAAIQLAADMFTSPAQLIELFQLADPKNKLVILKSMTSYQLNKLIPLLEQDDLVQGLRYFSVDGLMNLLQNIPKEELVKVVFQMFSERQVIEKMPEEQLDKLLTSTDMDKELVLKNMKFIPEMYLAQILESVTGQEAEGSSAELINQISQLGDLEYKNALRNFEPEQKRQLTLLVTTSDNRYYNNFDSDAYTHIISRDKEKEDAVKSMGVIKPEFLHKMMEELPNDLLAVVITQIDTEKFAQALITKYPELLAQFVAG